MAIFSPAALQETLLALHPPAASGDLCVAYSGGVDSTVLLAALADLKAAGFAGRIRALHIDHQLHPDSPEWRVRCAEEAQRWEIPYTAVRVEVLETSSQGLEAAARTARYAALGRELKAGEILLTAHHADDQLETMLLALLRGAGVRGLSGMPASARFGCGWHQRPLLAFTRVELEAWGRSRGLRWVEDPANQEPRYSRSFLRKEITPRLRSRWPRGAMVARRSAGYLAEATGLLDDLARLDLEVAATGEQLRVAALALLPSARRRNLLRFWLRSLGLPMPTSRMLAALEHDMLSAQEDRNPCVNWSGAEVRRHAGLLYAGPPLPAPPPARVMRWNWRKPCVLPENIGELHMIATTGRGLAAARLPDSLELHWRDGGERLVFMPPGGAKRQHRSLKKLLQELHVLPWWRDRLPLIGTAGRLIAVADLWSVPELAAQPGEPAVRIEWHDRPQIFATDRR